MAARARMEGSQASLCRRVGSPPLAHEAQQMFEGFIVGTLLLFSQLRCPLRELRGHLRRLFLRATQGHQDRRQLVQVHKIRRNLKTNAAPTPDAARTFQPACVYFTESAGTIL